MIYNFLKNTMLIIYKFTKHYFVCESMKLYKHQQREVDILYI